MVETFAKLFSILTTIERDYGISTLEKDERAIFDFIIVSIASGSFPATKDVVAAELCSRASTYRHLQSLKKAGLIFDRLEDGKLVIAASEHFESFGDALSSVAGAIKARS